VTTPLIPPDTLARVLTIAPAYRIEAPDNDVDAYVYRSHERRLLALQSRAVRDTGEIITLVLNGAHARDVVTGRDYGRSKRLTLTIDPITPIFLEIDR
jgi:hypothetical protein